MLDSISNSSLRLRVCLGLLCCLLVFHGLGRPSLASEESHGGGGEHGGGEHGGGEKKKKDAKDAPKAENGRISLPKLYVNLQNEEGLRRILLITLSLECEDNATAESLVNSKVRNDLIIFLSGKSDDELLSLEGKRKLRGELLKKFNEWAGAPKVKNIYFSDFVIQ